MKFKSTANYKIACHIFHIHISINLFLWGTKIYLFFKLRSYFFLEAKVRCFLHSNKQSLTLSIFRIHILRIHSPKTKQQRKYELKGKKRLLAAMMSTYFPWLFSIRVLTFLWPARALMNPSVGVFTEVGKHEINFPECSSSQMPADLITQ